MKHSPTFDGTHRSPVDRSTAILLAGGERYENPVKVACPHWEAKPALRHVPKDAPPLIGARFGRFTVIGLSREFRGSWVVRCSCGDYETRKAKAIRNPANAFDRCTKCRNVLFHLSRRNTKGHVAADNNKRP